jgi:hypothetical protein
VNYVLYVFTGGCGDAGIAFIARHRQTGVHVSANHEAEFRQ